MSFKIQFNKVMEELKKETKSVLERGSYFKQNTF